MSAEGNSSGYISMPNYMPFSANDLSANVQKPENMVNKWTDGRPPPSQLGTGQNVFRNENLEISKNDFLML